MNKLQKIWDVITGRVKGEEKNCRAPEVTDKRVRWEKDYRKGHREEFERLRNKIEKDGIRNEKWFYEYEGGIYCVKYPFIVKTGGEDLSMGKFEIYSINPDETYIDFADVPDLFDFINTYKK